MTNMDLYHSIKPLNYTYIDKIHWQGNSFLQGRRGVPIQVQLSSKT